MRLSKQQGESIGNGECHLTGGRVLSTVILSQACNRVLFLAALVLGAVGLQAVQAQIPIPPTPGTACEISQTQTAGPAQLSFGQLLVTLPAGHNYSWTGVISDPGGTQLVKICIEEFNSEVTINDSGAETKRVLNNPVAGPVLDQIVASVQIVSTMPPTVATQATPSPVSGASVTPTRVAQSNVRPPTAGDAGLVRP